MITTLLLSSLEKVFPNCAPVSTLPTQPTIFKNEPFNFQLAYSTDDEALFWKHWLNVRIDSPLSGCISIKNVDLVPSMFPSYANPDADYYTQLPGLFPDALMPSDQPKIKMIPNHWKSLWLEVTPTCDTVAGKYPITIIIEDGQGNEIAKECLTLTILAHELPLQTLFHTEWFHTDCIADFYKVPVFSEKHWELIEKFMKTAATHGINMLLTPLFTPPLDTAVGGDRTTVQLIDVSVENDTYIFNFDKLGRWVDTAHRAGVEYFELSHLFSQWGAAYSPKIMATVEGQLTKIFGWHVPAQDESYKNFLNQFLPQLVTYLNDLNLQGKCFFHVSDEPSLYHLEGYQAARNIIQPHIGDFPIIDALSDLGFYKTGALDHPIPANNHIDPFIEANVPDLWTYYCCAQNEDVSNRFMALPSFRNRIIAPQLFKYDIKGFLHWGYNFWNTQFSLKHINPFQVTDAGSAFPSGDSFLVYPGEDEVIESIRLKVFAEALYDLRAMQYLASLTSKAYVLELIESLAAQEITFSNFPRNAEYIHTLRGRINEEIVNKLA